MGTIRKRIEQVFVKYLSWPERMNGWRDMGQKLCSGRRLQWWILACTRVDSGWNFRCLTSTAMAFPWSGELQSELGRELQWRRRERRKRKREEREGDVRSCVWGKEIQIPSDWGL